TLSKSAFGSNINVRSLNVCMDRPALICAPETLSVPLPNVAGNQGDSCLCIRRALQNVSAVPVSRINLLAVAISGCVREAKRDAGFSGTYGTTIPSPAGFLKLEKILCSSRISL